MSNWPHKTDDRPHATPAPVSHAYTCAKCGVGVVVVGELLIRACEHDGPVHANMTAVVTQDGGLK